MIILDTCIIRAIGMHTSSADLLRTIGRSGVERVAVPWVVVEELAGQKALAYLSAWESAIRALENLAKASPWDVPAVGAADPEAIRDHWRNLYGDFVAVLPTSHAVMQQAIIREASALPPCKQKTDGKGTKGDKIGGRDAAIWLTAVEYAREHPNDIVYFVSSNTKDFGHGTSGYDYPMDQDLVGIEERFVHLVSLDDVAARFAEPISVDTDQVASALATAGEAIAADAVSRWKMDAAQSECHFECTWEYGGEKHTGYTRGWLDPDGVDARLLGIHGVSAYRIGEHIYATAVADWELAGYVLVHDGPLVYAAMKYETRVMVSLQEEGGALNVLVGEEPRGIDYEFSGRQGGRSSNPESYTRAIARAVPLGGAVQTELTRLVEKLLPPGPRGSYYPPMETAWSTLKSGHRPPR